MARSNLRRTIAFFGAASMLFACAGVLSLDDFSKGECAGARCGDGAPPDDVVTIDAGDSGKEGGPIEGGPDAQGSDPTAWARWKMPNYAALDGAAGPGVAMDLKAGDNADEVFDNVTGLVWKTAPLPDEANLNDARLRCDQLVQTGAKWRLPKRIELVTLLDYGQSGPPFIHRGTTPGSFVTTFTQAPIWTSSEVLVPVPTKAGKVTNLMPRKYWAVNFGTGELAQFEETAGLRVLCVKGLL